MASDAKIISPQGSKVNVSKAYSSAFEDTPDETVYADPLGCRTGEKGFDRRPDIRKNLEPEYRAIDEMMRDGASFRGAMAEVAAYKGLNVGDYSLPTYPQSDLTRLVDRNTPFWDLLPKITAQSNTVEQESLTDLAMPQIGGEREVPPDQDDTYQPQTLSMTYYRVTGSVSGPMNLASAGFRNAMGTEQQNKAEAMRQFSEMLALRGDPTVGDTSGALTDERGYQGIIPLARANGQEFDPAGGAGSTITPEDVRENFTRAVENGGNAGTTVHFTDLQTINQLKNALDDHDPVVIQGGPDGSVNIGAQSVMVDGQPVMHSDFMPGGAYDATANPDGRYFLTADMRFHSVRDLASTTMEMLGKRNDADEFFMKRYSVMMQAAGAHEYTSLITGIA